MLVYIFVYLKKFQLFAHIFRQLGTAIRFLCWFNYQHTHNKGSTSEGHVLCLSCSHFIIPLNSKTHMQMYLRDKFAFNTVHYTVALLGIYLCQRYQFNENTIKYNWNFIVKETVWGQKKWNVLNNNIVLQHSFSCVWWCSHLINIYRTQEHVIHQNPPSSHPASKPQKKCLGDYK